MYHPHHFLSQIKQMNQRTSVPANGSDLKVGRGNH